MTGTVGVIGVGVIGVGAMGAAHLATLARDVAGVRVVAVADPDTARAAGLVADLGLPDVTVTDDPLDVVGHRGVDAVLVASPDDTHHALVLACLDAGLPVLCEKPLATTARGGREIVDREVAGGRRLIQLGYMRRFDPGYAAIKQALVTGRWGAPLLVHCQHRNASAPPWFTADMPLLNSAVHEFDVVRWLLDTDVTRITVHTPRTTRHAGPALVDPRLVVLETAAGAVVDIEVFLGARYGYDVRCEVVAEDATLSLTPPSPVAVRTAGTDGHPVDADFRTRFADAYRIQLGAWIAAVRGGVPTGASAWDGYAASRTAEAGVAAATSGRAVDLAPEPVPPLYAATPTPGGTS